MARVDITQDRVLQAVVARLRKELTLDEASCYLTFSPLVPPTVQPGGDWYVNVSPGQSEFDEGMQIGGGQEQLMEDMLVRVTAFVRMRLDRAERDDRMLLEGVRGLTQVKLKILKALVAHDLVDPKLESNVFLRQLVVAASADKPDYDEEKAIGWQTINFRVAFDWDLT